MRPPAAERLASALLLAALAPAALAQVTQRVNVSWNGTQGNALSFTSLAVTPDGRHVVFFSDASNLVPGDTNGQRDVFLRDRRTGAIERVSVGAGGAQADGQSNDAWCSADGRYVSFRSRATNLVPGDTNGVWDCFVRDRLLGTTERVSVDSSGAQANDDSAICPISPDGRFVAFDSDATNLVPGDTNGFRDVFLHDRATGATQRMSVGPNGVQGNNESTFPFLSDDGRFVSFRSRASNLVAGDWNYAYDAFLRDRQVGWTERVNLTNGGTQSNPTGTDYGVACMVSGNGRFVVFRSNAANYVPGDSGSDEDLFVRDRVGHTTERISVDPAGGPANDESGLASITPDGRYVAFQSWATNLVPGGSPGGLAFVRDRATGTTELAGVDSHGIPANGSCLDVQALISANGRFVTFDSWATNLVPGDDNSFSDVFVHDRFGGADFESLCEPGVSGVIPCACGNPPAGPGRGCDNSAGTGGATLLAAGGTFLTSDHLVFTTRDEGATALSILMQGSAALPAGGVYGQGVSCVGGALLRRLFVKTASGGSITAPDFGAGDPQVSERSAALGDAIQAGESRWYVVVYRDPVVLGGCPSTSTFNATQTGRVAWSP